MIADMQGLCGAGAAGLDRRIEYGSRRLGGTGRGGRDDIIEQVADADFLEIGVAVGDRDQHKSLSQRRERWG